MDTPGPYPRSSFQWLKPPRIVEGLYRWRAFDLMGPLARSLPGSFITWPIANGQPMIKPPVFEEYHTALDALIRRGATDEALPWSVATKDPEVIVSWESSGVSFSLPGLCGGGRQFYDNSNVGWSGSARHGLQIPMLRMERILCGLLGQTWATGQSLAMGVMNRKVGKTWVRPKPEDDGPLQHVYNNAGYLAVEVFRAPRMNASLNAAVMHVIRVRDHRRKLEFTVEAQPALSAYRPRVCVQVPRSHDDEDRENTAAWFLLFVLLPATVLPYSTVERAAERYGIPLWGNLRQVMTKAKASVWMKWCALDPQALSTGADVLHDYEGISRLLLEKTLELTSYDAYAAEVRRIPQVGGDPQDPFQWVNPHPAPQRRAPPVAAQAAPPEELTAEEQEQERREREEEEERKAGIRARFILNKLAIPNRDYSAVVRALRQRIQAALPEEPLWEVRIPEASQALWALCIIIIIIIIMPYCVPYFTF